MNTVKVLTLSEMDRFSNIDNCCANGCLFFQLTVDCELISCFWYRYRKDLFTKGLDYEANL